MSIIFKHNEKVQISNLISREQCPECVKLLVFVSNTVHNKSMGNPCLDAIPQEYHSLILYFHLLSS